MAGELIQLVNDNREAIVRRLPTYLNAEQFFALCYQLERDAKLAAAAKRAPENLLRAILQAADLGLPIGSGHKYACTLITYGEKIEVSVNYHGIVYQLERAGAVIDVYARCVWDGDFLKVSYGDEEYLHHEPNLEDERRNSAAWMKDPKNVRGAYAVALLPDPLRRLRRFRYCTRGEIDLARSHSPNSDGPAWKNHYPAMAEKTAVWRVSKLIETPGKTEENREAWDRFGRTIDYENRRSHLDAVDEDEADEDPPGEQPSNPGQRKTASSGRRAEKGEAKTAGDPQPQNGEQKASPPPPPPPPTDGPISEDTQNKLWELMKVNGMKPNVFLKYLREKYGIPNLDDLKQSQVAEVEKFLQHE